MSVQETMQLPDYSGLVKAQQKLRPDDPPAAHVHFPIVDGGDACVSLSTSFTLHVEQKLCMYIWWAFASDVGFPTHKLISELPSLLELRGTVAVRCGGCGCAVVVAVRWLPLSDGSGSSIS